MAQILHEGERLKWWVEKKFKKYKDFVSTGVVSRYQMLRYYFKQQQIKRDMLQKFCDKLGITIDEFYKDVISFDKKSSMELVVRDPEKKYISFHQGRNLKSAINDKGSSITAVAKKMKVSRPTVYGWFKTKELPFGVLLELSHVLKMPVAQLKGLGEGQPSFERDIYLQLHELTEAVKRIENHLYNNSQRQFDSL